MRERLILTAILCASMQAIAQGSGPSPIPSKNPQAPRYAVKGVVVDPSGAVIQQAEVVFKGESGAIISHTGTGGSVNVNLEAGNYLVTVSAYGFATTKLVDFSVRGSSADTFRVSLELGQTDLGSGSPNIVFIGVPTIPSELPNVIEDQPTRTSLVVVQPSATKRRSMRCLNLWRCSGAQR